MLVLPEGVNFNDDITYLAKTNFRNKDQVFGIKRKDRRQHVYVLGKSGTGKSAMLTNMVIQNIYTGEGVCVVDPHGELVESILEAIPPHRIKDVIYFNPADTDYHVGFNVLQLDDPKYKHLVASGLMGIFTKIWANAWSARMEYILNNAILALLDTPGSTLLGIPRLLVDKDFRQQIINNLKDPVVKAFWIHEYEAWRDQFRNEAIAPIQNKVGQFLSTSIIRNVVGQAKSTIDLFEVMNSGKIFLVNVSKGRVGEDNSALLGGMLITKLQLAAMERVRIPEKDRKDFFLYVDEFQNFVTDSFASILSEARKYRLDLTIAHQYIGQLSVNGSDSVRDAVFGNVGTMIVFRVGAADAEFLEKEFEPEFTPQDVVNIPNYHIYLKLMVDGITSRPFSAVTMAPFVIEGGASVAEEIIQSSRSLYTRPREIVEREIADWSGMMVGSGDGSHATSTPNSSSSPGAGASTGFNAEGKFRALCSICNKETTVPFEPAPGRPVYCRDCIAKIKAGELQPLKVVAKRGPESKSFAPLANLGIEFDATKASTTETTATTARRPQPEIAPRPASQVSKSPSSTPSFAPKTPPVVQKFVAKERQAPDLAGLKSVLAEALSGGKTPSDYSRHSAVPTARGAKDEEVISVKPTAQAVSLSNLKKPSSTPVSLSTKDASTEHVSALKDVIAKAMGGNDHPRASVPEKEVGEDQKIKKEQEEKELAERQAAEAAAIAEAKQKLARLEEERKMLEEKNNIEKARKEAEQKQVELEEEKKRVLEAKAKEVAAKEEAEEAIRAKEKQEQMRAKEAEAASVKANDEASPPTPSKKRKEVPADVLNDILKM